MIKKVTVIGGGTIGSQIAFQTAYSGYECTIWLRSESYIKETMTHIHSISENYLSLSKKSIKNKEDQGKAWHNGFGNSETSNYSDVLQKIDLANNTIKIEYDIKKALADADLVIEAISENFDEKKNLFKMIAPILKEDAILTTSTQSMLPSDFVKYTGRPDKFLALHVANPLIKHNIGEIMAQDFTSDKTFTTIENFAKSINLEVVPIKSENNGYILNSLLTPLVLAALDLYSKGAASPKDIDRAWTIGTPSKIGPFELIDLVGVNNVYDIVIKNIKTPKFLTQYDYKAIAAVLKQMIDKNKLGISTGEGFYKYK